MQIDHSEGVRLIDPISLILTALAAGAAATAKDTAPGGQRHLRRPQAASPVAALPNPLEQVQMGSYLNLIS